MKIKELFRPGRPVISFEFFPPKTDKAEEQLRRALAKLQKLDPSFVSVTYGAGGSTREKTVDLVCQIKSDLGIEAMAHLTCVGSNREQIADTLARLGNGGIENILALRGDPPEGQEEFAVVEGGFAYASELTDYLRQSHDFCLGGACYPETHPECSSPEQDLANLKRKVEAGTDFLVTQLFFDADRYFGFLNSARQLGIDCPIVPGIMPVTNVDQVERFTRMCGATIPADLQARLDAVRDDPKKVVEVGVQHATDQCATLLQGGAPGIHFYTLNRSPATRAIFENLRSQGLV